MSSMINDLITEMFDLEAELVDLANEHRAKRERLEVVRGKLREITQGLPRPIERPEPTPDHDPEPEQSFHRFGPTDGPVGLSGDF